MVRGVSWVTMAPATFDRPLSAMPTIGRVVVGMGRSPPPPSPGTTGCRVAGRRRTPPGQIGLGLEGQHRHTEIGPERFVDAEGERSRQRRPAAPPAVDEVPVEDVGRGGDGVDVGGEEEGRL